MNADGGKVIQVNFTPEEETALPGDQRTRRTSPREET
jgi:hypothetical protein